MVCVRALIRCKRSNDVAQVKKFNALKKALESYAFNY
nr:MAG TPA: trypsin [Caudoviricetes sp.]